MRSVKIVNQQGTYIMSKKYLSMLAMAFAIPLLYMQWKYGGTELKQYIFPFLSYVMVVLGSVFFEKKYYIKALVAIMVATCSVFVIIALTNQAVPFAEKDYLVYMAFSIGIANMLILMKQFFGGVNSIVYLQYF